MRQLLIRIRERFPLNDDEGEAEVGMKTLLRMTLIKDFESLERDEKSVSKNWRMISWKGCDTKR